MANYAIRAADLYPTWNGEKQFVYVRAALYSYNQGRIIATSRWVYGVAFDTMTPVSWFDFNTDAFVGDHFRHTFINVPRGTYQVGVEFYWDRSSTGAPAGGTNPWIWEPGTCTFNV